MTEIIFSIKRPCEMFEGTTVPKLPEGFFDRSWHNDACAHFEKEFNGYIIEIWIERDNPDKRETGEQYLIGIHGPDNSVFEEFIEFTENDVSPEGLARVSKKLWLETYRLMKKYSKEK